MIFTILCVPFFRFETIILFSFDIISFVVTDNYYLSFFFK